MYVGSRCGMLSIDRKYKFDYCECRIQEEGEQYTYKSVNVYEAVFCYNYTNNPTKTPQATKIQLAVQSIRPKKIKTVLAVFYQLVFIA